MVKRARSRKAPAKSKEAAVAQAVAHLIGSEEVTGPSPVSSLKPEIQ